MGKIEFTRNYSDLCTNKGFQFEFYCDKCAAQVIAPDFSRLPLAVSQPFWSPHQVRNDKKPEFINRIYIVLKKDDDYLQ